MDFKLSLESERVGSTQPDDPLATTPDATVASVLQLLCAQKVGAVLVCDGDQLVGVFTERDALRLMAERADLSQRIGDVMSTDVVTARVDTTVGDAIGRMAKGGYRHLPIVNERGAPTGSVAVHGIVHYLVEHFPDTVYTQPPDSERPQAQREGA